MTLRALSFDLDGLARVGLDEDAVKGLTWRDFGTGVKLAKLAREGRADLVLYHVAAGAPRDAFAPHRHVGGEAYLVLKGVIADESGRFPRGSFVWLPADSRHRPWAEGETVVLVLWPEGIRVEHDR